MKKEPYKEDIIAKCVVCNSNVLVDEFGQGLCNHCGWEQNNDCLDFPDKVRYPNRVSYDKAKQLYKEGKPFNPTLEDLVGGLFFYSEMQFRYYGREFGIALKTKELVIEFFENHIEESLQYYKTKEEFIANAYIDNKLLKDIWEEVENVNYMLCY